MLAQGPLGLAEAAAVAEEVDVDLVGVRRVAELAKPVVRLLERCFRPDQPEARRDAVDVRIDRQLGPVIGEEQNAGGGLAPDPGQRFEELERVLPRRALEEVEVREPPVSAARTLRRISCMRLDLTLRCRLA